MKNLRFVNKTVLDGVSASRFEVAQGQQVVMFVQLGELPKLTRADEYDKDGRLVVTTVVDWDLVDGFALIRHVAMSQFDSDGAIREASEIEVTELDLNADIQMSELELSDYAGCTTRRLIDRRSDAAVPVLYFEGNSRAELKKTTSLAEVAESLKPLQVGEPKRTVVRDSQNIFPTLLVLNGSVLVLIACVIAVRQLSRRK